MRPSGQIVVLGSANLGASFQPHARPANQRDLPDPHFVLVGERLLALKLAGLAYPLRERARLGGHGTSEYYLLRDFLDAIEKDTPPPIDVAPSMGFAFPGIVAHECSITDGN